MRSIWTRAYWQALAERALSSGAQVALWTWGAGALPDTSLPWWTVPAGFGAGVALGALKGLAVNQVTGNGPGVGDAEQVIDD